MRLIFQFRKVNAKGGSKLWVKNQAVLIGESRGIVDVMSETNRAMLNWRILTTLPKMKWSYSKLLKNSDREELEKLWFRDLKIPHLAMRQLKI